MAIPTNPILINDITAVATAVENEDFLLVDQAGVHKKLPGTFLAGASLWTLNIGDTINYGELFGEFVGVGIVDSNWPLHISTLLSGEAIGMIVHSDLADGNHIDMSTPSASTSSKKPGIQLSNDSGPRWTDVYDATAASFSLNYSSGTERIKFLSTGEFLTPTMPVSGGISGELFNNGGVINVTP